MQTGSIIRVNRKHEKSALSLDSKQSFNCGSVITTTTSPGTDAQPLNVQPLTSCAFKSSPVTSQIASNVTVSLSPSVSLSPGNRAEVLLPTGKLVKSARTKEDSKAESRQGPSLVSSRQSRRRVATRKSTATSRAVGLPLARKRSSSQSHPSTAFGVATVLLLSFVVGGLTGVASIRKSNAMEGATSYDLKKVHRATLLHSTKSQSVDKEVTDGSLAFSIASLLPKGGTSQKRDQALLSQESKVGLKGRSDTEMSPSNALIGASYHWHEAYDRHVGILTKKVLNLIYKHGALNQNANELAIQIVTESRRQGYDPLFVAAVIKSESAFNRLATSKVGARGLMQIMPGTGKYVETFEDIKTVRRGSLTEAGYNLTLGIRYLKYLDDLFNNNKLMTLMAYNWGPGKVERTFQGKNAGVPPEVVNYAIKILNDHRRWQGEVVKG
jgi:Transglycosylase SLT domain